MMTMKGPVFGPSYLSPSRRKLVNALILTLGAMLALSLAFGNAAFAKQPRTEITEVASLDLTRGQKDLAGHLGASVRLTAWMTYVPDHQESAILRAERAPFFQSLLAMNLQTFGRDAANAQAEEGSLFVRVHRVPVDTRVWMVQSCSDGCRVRVEGTVIKTAAGRFSVDVDGVHPAD